MKVFKFFCFLFFVFYSTTAMCKDRIRIGLPYNISDKVGQNAFFVEFPLINYEAPFGLLEDRAIEDEGVHYLSSLYRLKNDEESFERLVQESSLTDFSKQDLILIRRGINNWDSYDSVQVQGYIDLVSRRIYLVGVGNQDGYIATKAVILEKNQNGFGIPFWQGYDPETFLVSYGFSLIEKNREDYADFIIEESGIETCIKVIVEPECIFYLDLDIHLLSLDDTDSILKNYISKLVDLIASGNSIRSMIDDRAFLFLGQSNNEVLKLLNTIINQEYIVMVNLNGFVFFYSGSEVNGELSLSSVVRFIKDNDEIILAQTPDMNSLDNFFNSDEFKEYLLNEIEP